MIDIGAIDMGTLTSTQPSFIDKAKQSGIHDLDEGPVKRPLDEDVRGHLFDSVLVLG